MNNLRLKKAKLLADKGKNEGMQKCISSPVTSVAAAPTMNRLESLEHDLGVELTYKPETKSISIKGREDAAARARECIAESRDEIVKLLKKRQGLDLDVVEIEIPATDVPSKEAQRASYIEWFSRRDMYYRPTTKELDRMMAAVADGDLIVPNFALSFSVRRPDGTLYTVNRQGRITNK